MRVLQLVPVARRGGNFYLEFDGNRHVYKDILHNGPLLGDLCIFFKRHIDIFTYHSCLRHLDLYGHLDLYRDFDFFHDFSLYRVFF